VQVPAEVPDVVVPLVVPEVVPEVVAEVVPLVVPDVVPLVVPAVVPEVVPLVVPEVVPLVLDVVPEVELLVVLPVVVDGAGSFFLHDIKYSPKDNTNTIIRKCVFFIFYFLKLKFRVHYSTNLLKFRIELRLRKNLLNKVPLITHLNQRASKATLFRVFIQIILPVF
jgi:hypothetical protein